MVIFEDFWKRPDEAQFFIGSEILWRSAKNSGQLEGWNEQLDKKLPQLLRG